jgi:hypothetical protein
MGGTSLGRVDDFDRSKVDEIVSALEGYTDKVDVLSSIEDCHHVWSKEYGSVYVMEKLWHELKMDSILSGLLRGRQFEFDVQSAIRGMVINRAVNAGSKLSTCEWMDKDAYCSQREELELYHRDDRIMAHAFLCVLSHLLERLMEKKLEASGLDMTARRALGTLGAMKLTKVRLKEKEYLIRTDATPEITEIFKALHYRMPPRIQMISAE